MQHTRRSERLPTSRLAAGAVLWLAAAATGACADYERYESKRELDPRGSAGAPSSGGRTGWDGGDASSRPDGGDAGSRGDGGDASSDHDGGDASSNHDGGDAGSRGDGGAPDASEGGSHRSLTHIGFDAVDSLDLFEFRSPADFVEGPGDWIWAMPAGTRNPALLQVTNVSVGTATDPAPTGTYAVLRNLELADGWVSVHLQSSDDDTAGLLLRFQDDYRHYRFTVNEKAWAIERLEVSSEAGNARLATPLLCGGICRAGVPRAPGSSSFALDWRDGHVLRFEGVGDQLSAYLNGELLGAVTDSVYSAGRVGLMTRALQGAYFDDFTIYQAP